MMKPVLFNTEMVKAILEKTPTKRKTQTRCIIKPQPELSKNVGFCANGICYGLGFSETQTQNNFISCKSKYQIGDILYVRETFKIGAWREDGRFAVDYKASPEIKNTPWITFENDEDGEKFNKLMANTINELNLLGYPKDEDGLYRWVAGESPLKWKPSIHMPKEAARIFLEVTDVRIERLQDISEEDAKAEGCTPKFEMSLEEYMDKKTDFNKASSYYVGFKHLWKSLKPEAGYSWDDNPFVWVYQFKLRENKL